MLREANELHIAVQSNNLNKVKEIIKLKKYNHWNEVKKLYTNLLAHLQKKLATIENELTKTPSPDSSCTSQHGIVKNIISLYFNDISHIDIQQNDYKRSNKLQKMHQLQEIQERVERNIGEIISKSNSLREKYNKLENRARSPLYSIDSMINRTTTDINDLNFMHHLLTELNKAIKNIIQQIQAPLPIDKKNINNYTPLQIAASQGFTSALQYLINKGANKFVKDGKGNHLLHLASANGHGETIKILVGLMPESTLYRNADSLLPMEVALRNEHFNIAETLIPSPPKLECILNFARYAIYSNEKMPSRITQYLRLSATGSLTSENILQALKYFYSQKKTHPIQNNLYLSHLFLDDKCFINIWTALPDNIKSNIKLIDLSNNNLKTNSIDLLARFLKTSSKLITLNLSANSALGGDGLIPGAAIKILADILAKNPRLEVLNLANTGLNNQDLKALLNSLNSNVNLKSLDISDNPKLTKEIAIYFDEMLANRNAQASLMVKMDNNPHLPDKLKQSYSKLNCASEKSALILSRRRSTPSLITDSQLRSSSQAEADLSNKKLTDIKNEVYRILQVYKAAAIAYQSKWYKRKDISNHERIASGIKTLLSTIPKFFGLAQIANESLDIIEGTEILEKLTEYTESLDRLIEKGESALEFGESLRLGIINKLVHGIHFITGKEQVDNRLKIIADQFSGVHAKEKCDRLASAFVHIYQDQISLLTDDTLPVFTKLIRKQVSYFLLTDQSEAIDSSALINWFSRARLTELTCITLCNQSRILMRNLFQRAGLRLLDKNGQKIEIDIEIKQLEDNVWIMTNGDKYGYREIDTATLNLLVKIIQNTQNLHELDFIRIPSNTLTLLQNAQPLQFKPISFKPIRERVSLLEEEQAGMKNTINALKQHSSSVQQSEEITELKIELSAANKEIKSLNDELKMANNKIENLQAGNLQLKDAAISSDQRIQQLEQRFDTFMQAHNQNENPRLGL